MKKVKKTIRNVTGFLSKLIQKNKLLSIILFITFFVRILGLIPNEYHDDEPWIEKYSGEIFYNIVTKGDFTPHDYKYGSFTFYLNAIPYFPISFIDYSREIVQSIFFPINQSKDTFPSYREYVENLGPPIHRNIVIFWIQRAMAAFMGGSNVLIIYLITKKLFNRNTALLSAFALAVMPLHVRESHYFAPDIPMTFFMSLAILFMVNLFQAGKLKWHILTGFMIGFSSTFKYFPLAFLAYPFSVLLEKQKNFKWLLKIALGLFFIIVGVFVGVPYLFLRQQDRIFFHDEMVNFVLLWYNTPFTRYAQSLGELVVSHGQTSLPSLTTLIPTMFRPFYASLLFFKGLGPIPSIMAVLGMIILLIKFPKKFLFLAVIPVFVFIYNSSNVPATYERQADPMLPFLAIFIGIFLYAIWNFLKDNNIKYKKIIFTITLIITFYFPFTQSFASSWACGETSTFDQSIQWIEKNIPNSATVSARPSVPFPSNVNNPTEMREVNNFYIEEVKSNSSEYAFLNLTTILVYSINDFRVNFFVPPQDVYKNNFIPLSLYEYGTRAKLLKKISKPDMCNQPTFLYYKLPPPVQKATHLLKDFTFDNIDDLDFWHLQEYSIKYKDAKIFYSQTEGKYKLGSLGYAWTSTTYTMPRVVSQKIEAKENSVYTFSSFIKSAQDLTDIERDGFLRVDFYDNKNSQVILPGSIVGLSQRTFGKSAWRKLDISIESPPRTKFMTLSLQINGSKRSGFFYFDAIELFGP